MTSALATFTVIPAFGFGSPLLLWGLLLGGLPLLIHLLHRRRYRETSWAAMRFLQQAIRARSRRIRLEHLLLLIIRTLIVLLVVVALARPYAESFARYFSAELPWHHVLVIDNSLSMRYRTGTGTRFEQAREIARQIVRSAPQGHAFNLIRLGGIPPLSVIARPSWQQDEVLQEIDQLQPAWEAASLQATLDEVEQAVAQLPEISRCRISIISDLQRSTWWPDSPELQNELRTRLSRLATDKSLTVFDVGGTHSPNLAVIELNVEEALIRTGQPVKIRAVIDADGPATAPDASVELVVAGRTVQSRSVELRNGRSNIVEFNHTFHDSGDHEVAVRIADDQLPADNVRRLVLPVRERYRILLVNGVPAGRERRQATWYLYNALSDSQEEGGASQLPVDLQTIADAELSSTNLEAYDCLLLSNVAVLTAREAGMLRAFVEAGGGVAIFPGDRTLLPEWNRNVFSGENRLLPLQLAGRVGNAREPEQTWSFESDRLEHPVVAPFRESPGTGLESTLIWEYLRITLSAETPLTTVLSLSSGDPAIVEGSLGAGRVLLFATAADDRWSTWTTLGGGAFVPMLHETVRRLLAGEARPRAGTVGDSLNYLLPTPPPGLTVSAADPAGDAIPVQLGPATQSLRITPEPVRQSGIYPLRLGAPISRTLPFAFNPDPEESRLGRLSREQLETDLLPATGFRYRTGWQEQTTSRDPLESARAGLSRWLLLLAFGLLCVEQVMAWRFAPGVVLLVAVCGLFFSVNAFAWHPVAGWVTVAVATTTVLTAVRKLLVPTDSHHGSTTA